MIQDSKLVYYLGQLSSRQRTAFRDFLASPYFNKKIEPRSLFEVIERRVLRYKKATLSPEAALEHVFPGQPFSKDAYRKLMNLLLNLLMEFLAHETLRKDERTQLRATHKAVSSIGADRYFEFLHNKVNTVLDPFDIDYYDHAFQMEMNLAELQSKKTLRSRLDNFDQLVAHMDHGYMIKKLNLGYYAASNTGVTEENLEIPDLGAFLKDLRASIEELPLLVQMFYWRYMTLARKDEPEHFHNLKALLDAHSSQMSKPMAAELYRGILGYSIYRVNFGDPDFLPELLRVYQAMLRQGHLVDDGYLPAAHFKNIVVVASRAGELEWAEWFMDQFGDQIDPKLKEGALTYNQAVIDYFMHSLREAERGFQVIVTDPKDLYYGVDARVYLLRIYYETGNFDGMDSLCHSFRIYLTRNQTLPDRRKKQYLTFLALYRRLMNIPPRDGERLLRLKEDILASPRIAPRAWLLEKLEVLIKNLPQRYR